MKTLSKWNHKLLYHDKFSLYSSGWNQEEDGIYEEVAQHPVIEDAPCHISVSRNSLSSNNRLDQPYRGKTNRNTVEKVLLMFCDAEYKITPGDLLKITHQGVTEQYLAGDPHKYIFFQELLVYILKDA